MFRCGVCIQSIVISPRVNYHYSFVNLYPGVVYLFVAVRTAWLLQVDLSVTHPALDCQTVVGFDTVRWQIFCPWEIQVASHGGSWLWRSHTLLHWDTGMVSWTVAIRHKAADFLPPKMLLWQKTMLRESCEKLKKREEKFCGKNVPAL